MNKKELVEKYLDWINFQYDNGLKTNNAAILGKWGSGKTTLINEISVLFENSSSDHEKRQGFIINLWNYETFDGDKLLLLIYDLTCQIYEKNKDLFEMENNNKPVKENKGRRFFKKISTSMSLAINVNPLPFLGIGVSFDKPFSDTQEESNIKKNPFRSINEMIKDFKDFCQFLGDKGIKILIIFDELDRCSPDVILELLTCIKQILIRSEIANVFYLTTINRSQIDKILSPKESNESYVEKIFDYFFNLENDTELWLENPGNNFIKIFLDNQGKTDGGINYRMINQFTSSINNIDTEPHSANDKLQYFLDFFSFYYKNKVNRYDIVLLSNEVDTNLEDLVNNNSIQRRIRSALYTAFSYMNSLGEDRIDKTSIYNPEGKERFLVSFNTKESEANSEPICLPLGLFLFFEKNIEIFEKNVFEIAVIKKDGIDTGNFNSISENIIFNIKLKYLYTVKNNLFRDFLDQILVIKKDEEWIKLLEPLLSLFNKIKNT